MCSAVIPTSLHSYIYIYNYNNYNINIVNAIMCYHICLYSNIGKCICMRWKQNAYFYLTWEKLPGGTSLLIIYNDN